MASVKSKGGSQASARRSSGAVAVSVSAMAFLIGIGNDRRPDVDGFKLQIPRKTYQILARRPVWVKILLRQYGWAIERSRQVGRRVSFRVDVDPTGAATMTPIEEATPSPGRVLQDALIVARGRLSAAEILDAEDMLDTAAFAAVLGVTRRTVNIKRRNGQLLGLDGAKSGFRFPVWQLDAEDRPFPELPILHAWLGGAWAVYRFLVQPHGALNGLTGRQALEQGRSKAVLKAVEDVAGDFR